MYFWENGNLVRFERLGPEVNEEVRFQQIITQQFDEVDRLITGMINGQPFVSFTYNALGRVTAYKNAAGIEKQVLHDEFGRWAGQLSTSLIEGTPTQQQLLYRVERDGNNRIVARINAAGHRTQYQYGARNLRTAITYADGTTTQIERDGSGNIVRILNPNGTMIARRFDALNRLVERQIEQQNRATPQVERFHYNGLNRIVSAATNAASVRRRWDSLSRVLEETQIGGTIRYDYNAAGNRIQLTYPGGQEVHKSYDMLKRVLQVRDGGGNFIAQYTYRSSEQPERLRLANGLEAHFAYEPLQNRLSVIVYQSTADGGIIEGNRYRYDSVGNRLHEAQLHRGNTSGERYFYDAVPRLVKVQYGVENLDDSNSRFEREVQYDLSPVGTWQRRTVRNADGQVLEQRDGVTNQRDAYLSLGDVHFEYDANNNRTFAAGGHDSVCAQRRYSYDYANRSTQIECLDTAGNVVQTVEYAYDTFGRQVLKRTTDSRGTRAYTRVWNGRQLVEEWEDGKLAKSFVYGAWPDEPVKMSRHTPDGIQDFFYTLNGRGFVTALVNQDGQVAERYRYDVFGQPFLSEFEGEPIPLMQQPSSSPLGNPLFAGTQIWDSDTALSFDLGRAYDPVTGQFTHSDTPRGVVSAPPLPDETFQDSQNLFRKGDDATDSNVFQVDPDMKNPLDAFKPAPKKGQLPMGPFDFSPEGSSNGPAAYPPGSLPTDPSAALDQVLNNSPDPYNNVDPLDLLDATETGSADHVTESGNDGGAQNAADQAAAQKILDDFGIGTGKPGTSGNTTPSPGDPTPSPSDPNSPPGDPTPAPGDPTPSPSDPNPPPGDPNPSPGDPTPSGDPTAPDDPNTSGGIPNPDGGGPGGPAGLPNPDGGGPGGLAGYPNPEGNGPGGPLFYPNPDGGGPGGPASLVGTVGGSLFLPSGLIGMSGVAGLSQSFR